MPKAMHQKVLLITATSFLGKKLYQILSSEFTVIGTYHASSKGMQGLVPLDITRETDVTRCIIQHNPDIVVVTAAMSNVDACEQQKEQCHALQVQGIQNIAQQCSQRKLVYFSTDFVFDGEKGNYTEDDQPNPQSYYASTKREGEKIVQGIKDHLICRVAVLYGYDADNPKFINQVIQSLRKHASVKAITDQFRTPTLIDEIAEAVLKLLQKDATGIYHVVGEDRLSFYEMAHSVAEVFSLDARLIQPVNAAQLKQIASRPRDSSLCIERLKSEGIFMSSFKQGLFKLKTQMEGCKTT